MKVICAWCDKVVSEGGGTVSHGICPECALQMLRKLPAHYLASIADADGTVTLFSGHKFRLGDEESRPQAKECESLPQEQVHRLAFCEVQPRWSARGEQP